jgi:hypothetical protein
VASGLVQYSSLSELADNRTFEFGQIYLITDQLLSIPDADRVVDGRNIRTLRPIVIISNNGENTNPVCPTITVAPLSKRADLFRPNDLELFKKQDKVVIDCILRFSLAQPVLKKDIGDLKGKISKGKKQELITIIEEYYGLTG